MKKNILITLIFLCSITITFAETYKVKSLEDFKSIAEKLVAGDKVIIQNGNYTNWFIELNNKGTAEKPIIIMAETNGQVVFSGDVERTIFKITGNFIYLQGINFKTCVLKKAEKSTGVLIELNGTSNCKVSHCNFESNVVKSQFMPLVVISGNGESNKIDSCNFTSNVDNQDVQIKVTKESFPLNTKIIHNSFSFKNKVSWKNGNGGECVQVGQDPVLLGNQTPKTFVSENTFTACNGENEVISNKSSGNSYTKNHFKNNDGELVMRGGHDCIISDNTFEGGTGGIRINGTGHLVTNNKITGIKTAIRLMYGMAKGKTETGFYISASNCKITNNTISNADTGILVGDSKNADWTGKFDVKKYPSPVLQNVQPFDNEIYGNHFKNVKIEILKQ